MTNSHSHTFFRTSRRGGIRFIQLGRHSLTWSVSRKPLNDSARAALDWLGLMLISPLLAAGIVHFLSSAL